VSILEGDCLDVMPTLAAESARLVFADPPYNIGIDYGEHHDDRMPPAEYLDWCRRWIGEAARLLTPDGSMWVLINWEWADHFGLMLREAGLHRRRWIVWYETFGVNCSNNFNRTSRPLFHMVKDPRPGRCVFHKGAVNRPSDRQAKYNDPRADPDGKIWDDVWGINPRIPRLVGNAKERIKGFPTQLPKKLLRPIIGCATDPGDLVVDPFSGSATTAYVATELGRRCIGIEESSRFARLSRLRLARGVQKALLL
jgi:DNA modification methylase